MAFADVSPHVQRHQPCQFCLVCSREQVSHQAARSKGILCTAPAVQRCKLASARQGCAGGGQSAEGGLYDSYDPLLLEQHAGGNTQEFETFDAAVDEFYSKAGLPQCRIAWDWGVQDHLGLGDCRQQLITHSAGLQLTAWTAPPTGSAARCCRGAQGRQAQLSALHQH